jgi:hypothetical protein
MNRFKTLAFAFSFTALITSACSTTATATAPGLTEPQQFGDVLGKTVPSQAGCRPGLIQHCRAQLASNSYSAQQCECIDEQRMRDVFHGRHPGMPH